MNERAQLTRYAWLSIATALITIVLKAGAYLLTGSVGLLSDALESGVNLVAALIALIALTVAARPPDEEHLYGHTKAEYFSSGIEGAMIVVAAVLIISSATDRLLNPQPLQRLETGLLVSLLAAILNLLTALVLSRAGKEYESATLQADARHLMTDVWTTGGVLLAVALVAVTGIGVLDPIIAILVAIQIIRSGLSLLRGSALGLMDTALPEPEVRRIRAIVERHIEDGVQYHALRTRQSGAQRFVSLHIQVPGAWSVQRGHALLEEVEGDIRGAFPRIAVFTHLEPVEDPVSWQDIELNRDRGNHT
ncbi:MAG TPA: cation diffusion facilitator family transporter [Candidatus Binatia bacterium]|jgi:cation diffusion facilitator family transporter|nr:cation diffusion facilitator family transporter [Candidatus Binatia bacterium]